MRLPLFLFLIFFCIVDAQPNWQRSVTNYNRQTYKAANQNWMIVQHEKWVDVLCKQ